MRKQAEDFTTPEINALEQNPDRCPVCGEAPTIMELRDEEQVACELEPTQA